MSDQTPLDAVADPDVDEFTQALFAAMERRSPVSPSADQAPETEADAPGGEEPVEGQEPPPPETAPEAPPDVLPPEEHPPQEEEPGEGEPPGEGDGQLSPAFTLSGRDYSNEQVAQALPLYDWFARLEPGQVQAIDALLSGQYRLVPSSEAVQPPQPQAAPGTSATSPSPPSAMEDEGEWLDTKAQREIAALRQQMTDMQQVFQQNLAPVVQTQQQADYNTRLAAINQSHAEFQHRYDLTDEAMDALEVTIAESQVLPGLAHKHGTLKAGMDAALDMAFWSTPVYRDKYLADRQVSKEAEQQAEDTATVRKQHLTALSGSGGSAPRREPVPSTPEDRHAAMVAEIAQAMNGSGQVQ